MSEIESTKEKINLLRDEYRHNFIFLMAILTGSTSVVYQLILGSIDVKYILIVIVGMLVSLYFVKRMQQTRTELDELIEKLEKL